MKLREAGRWAVRHQETLLLTLTLFLFISKSLYNVPFTLMALLGLYRLLRGSASLRMQPQARFYGLAFLSLWLPMLFAFTDPVNLARSAHTVWPYLRFFLAGAYVLHGLRRHNPRAGVETAFFIIMTLWSLDAVLQFLAGRDIFGYPYVNGVHITGMFYPELTIGHVLAGLSAPYFDSLRRRSRGRPWIWLLLIPLFMVVFLTGRRSVWFMLLLNTFGFLGYRLYLAESRRRFLARALAATVGVAAVLAILFVTQESVQRRVDKTMGLFSTDIEAIDRATSSRVDIWRTSWRMYQAHWINGVGPRGFRYVYQDYADPDFKFYETSVTHPHMLVLEIAAETGSIGLAGYLLFLALLLRTAWHYRREESTGACLIGILAASFPINAHVAFYGSYWSSLLWWLMLLLVINVHDAEQQREELRLHTATAP